MQTVIEGDLTIGIDYAQYSPAVYVNDMEFYYHLMEAGILKSELFRYISEHEGQVLGHVKITIEWEEAAQQ